MKAEDFIELIEQNRFDKISKNGMTLIAERFRELQSKQLTLSDVVKSDSEQLHTEVFNLANKLAINGYGNEAVKMHGICNGM
jgi:hypothetical protein